VITTIFALPGAYPKQPQAGQETSFQLQVVDCSAHFRMLLPQYHPAGNRFCLWSTNQSIHRHKRVERVAAMDIDMDIDIDIDIDIDWRLAGHW